MFCPSCSDSACRRSQRRGTVDFFASGIGLRPWRCVVCDTRFRAWSVAPRFVRFAHCAICGNLELDKISRVHGLGKWRLIGRWLRLPAYRCAPCRNRFFSIRPRRTARLGGAHAARTEG